LRGLDESFLSGRSRHADRHVADVTGCWPTWAFALGHLPFAITAPLSGVTAVAGGPSLVGDNTRHHYIAVSIRAALRVIGNQR
jgi:hypothetical protein